MKKELVDEKRDQKAIEIGYFIIFTHCTLKTAAKKFKVSKSTIHNYCQRLKVVDQQMYEKIQKILELNFYLRHARSKAKRKAV
jgi:putative DeoR family transcriptional regulator (stage III sporulation protein D)